MDVNVDVDVDVTGFAAALARDDYDGPTEIVLPPGARRDPHTHDFAVRGLVTGGEFILVCDGAPHSYRPGEVFVLDRGRTHYEAAGPKGATYLVGKRAA